MYKKIAITIFSDSHFCIPEMGKYSENFVFDIATDVSADAIQTKLQNGFSILFADYKILKTNFILIQSEKEKNTHCRIFALLNENEIHLRNEIYDLNVHDYILIPLNINELVSKINHYEHLMQKESEISHFQDLVDELSLFAMAVEQSANVVVITDTKGTIEYVNPMFTKLNGYTFDEAKGQNPRILNSGKIPKATYNEMWKVLSEGKQWQGEFHNKTKWDTFYWEWATISPIRNKQGEIVKYLAIKEDITKQKKVLLELEQNTHLLKLVISSVDEGIALSRDDGRFEIYNPKMEEITGIRKEEANGWGLLETLFIDEKDRAYIMQKMSELNDVGQISADNFIFSKDGSLKHILITTTVLYHDVEKLYLTTFRDITERKKYEVELAKSELLLKRAQKMAKLGNWTWNLEDNKIQWSEVVFEIFEIEPRQHFSYDEFKKYILPEDLPIVVKFGEKARTERVNYSYEYRIKTVNGTIKYLITQGEPEFSTGGELLRVVGTVQDITARKLQELAMIESEKKYRTIIETANDAILIADAKTGFIVEANQKAAILLKMKHEQIIGTFHSDIHPPELKEIYAETFKNHSLQKGAFDREMLVLASDGERIPVQISANVAEINGKLYNYGIFYDLRQRKKSEEMLKKAKEKAEAASLVKSQFLANISHEIRTPLNSIIGFADLLVDRFPDNTHIINYLKGIKASASTLMNLINDILDLTKFEAQSIKMYHVPTDIRLIINEISNIFIPQVKERQLVWEMDITPQMPKNIKIDDKRLRQILLNLVGNAVKFTDKGFVRIEISDVRVSENRKVSFCLLVEDSGIGIPSELHQSIFEPFSQQENFSTRKYQGTGLGLAITKRLVENMGAAINVESEVNRGAKFIICFKDIEIATDLNVGLQLPDGEEIGLDSGLSQQEYNALLEHLRVKFINDATFKTDTKMYGKQIRSIVANIQIDMDIEEIGKLTKLLDEMGKKHSIEMLCLFSKNMEKASEMFDFDKIMKQMPMVKYLGDMFWG